MYYVGGITDGESCIMKVKRKVVRSVPLHT
jgi:hypothetical protein